MLKVLSQDADNEYATIDSTIVRAHQHSSGEKKESYTSGAIGSDRLLLHLKIEILIADKGYYAHIRVVKPLLDSGKQLVMPSLHNRKHRLEYNRFLYRRRNLIENFFAC